MDRRLLIILGLGCAGICLLGGAILLAGGASFIGALRDPEQIGLEVRAPMQAGMGDSFVIEVDIENRADEPQILDSIDISDDYLTGIGIEATQPAFIDSQHVFGFQSYEFQRQILPNGSLIVQFRAVVFQPGDFKGDWDVCINGPGNCLSIPVRTFVSE